SEASSSEWKLTVIDIDERKQVESNLKYSEAKFRSISQSASDAIVATDSYGHIQVWNPAAAVMFGYSEEEILGKPLTILMPDRFHAAHELGLRRVRQTGSSLLNSQTMELQGLRHSGEEFPLALSISMWAIHGTLNFSAIIQDLTERKKREDELHHAISAAETANRAKTLFLAHVSHEIRTPMNSILGMGEELVETTLDPDQQHFVDVLNRSGLVLMALINDVLDLSKIEAGQLELETLVFDLRRLIEDVREVLEPQAKNSENHLSCFITDNTPTMVRGDPQRLRQILINLLGNAIKFTKKGKVTLKVQVDAEDLILFTVSDTGIGIPSDQHDAIFHPFIQGETFSSRRFGGTGLGLSITRHLIDLMNGRIWVESCVGQGSTFYFTLHLPPSDDRGDSEKCAPETHNNDLEHASGDAHTIESLSILVVDDSDDNRLLIKTFLRKTAHHVDLAKDGEEGYEMFIRRPYDVVLMDIQMPIMDGYAATRKIRAWEQREHSIPARIIALTAHAMKEVAQQVIDAGCDHYLSKPIRKQHLLTVLDQIHRPGDGRPGKCAP
ncbi:MAG: PAS domain S-box protein, partial [Magnetococcales bacterium]|nr:PAS domain S-box protein [Magnetococcales bacterium]